MTLFPTGKPHISFSELSHWRDCPFRHKLLYIDKLGKNEPSVYLDFGTCIHAILERYLETREMITDDKLADFAAAWEQGTQSDGYLPDNGPHTFDEWKAMITAIAAHVPSFLDETFPGWEYHNSEELLYEDIEGVSGVCFKGYIDGVIKVTKGKKQLYWLIDWKTTGWGWRRDKLEKSSLQLVLYKMFWAKKYGIPMKDIRCAFILLKRDDPGNEKESGLPKSRCHIIPVSVGPKTSDKADKQVKAMIRTVKMKSFTKNRFSCRYCEFKDTVHCP